MASDSVTTTPSTPGRAPTSSLERVDRSVKPTPPLAGGVSQGVLDGKYRDLAVASLMLAKRFGRGGTLWALAPGMTAHAFHISVEFVHPVIVGKKALPALALSSSDPLSELRQLSRAGDILVGIGPGDDPTLNQAMQRAPVYGLSSIWIASGTRPAMGSADHVIWLDDEEGLAGYLGHFVMVYHLLWELTHVCFEHPGLLQEEPDKCEGPLCVTCSDQGDVMEVVADLGQSRAKVRGPSGTEVIDVSLVGEIREGDLVLVHGGSAISGLKDLP